MHSGDPGKNQILEAEQDFLSTGKNHLKGKPRHH